MKDKQAIYQNRVRNMQNIMRALGGPNATAEAIGRNVSQLTDTCGPNPKRNIGDKLAGDLERQLGLAPGALDAEPPAEVFSHDDLIARAASAMTLLSADDKELVLHMIECLSSRQAWRNVQGDGASIFPADLAKNISDYPRNSIESSARESEE